MTTDPSSSNVGAAPAELKGAAPVAEFEIEEQPRKSWFKWLPTSLKMPWDKKEFNHGSRVISFPPPLPSEDADIFCSNKVVTAKYNVLTFLPKNLFEQFRRVANFYFLIMLILQLIPELRAWPAGIAAVPLVIVLGATALKDMYEDMKRWKSDIEINRSTTHTLKDGAWVKTHWEALKVGDIVRLEMDESIPADIICLSSSSPDGECYVETRNLDGETNVKTRLSISSTKSLVTAEELSTLAASIHVDRPVADMYHFSGVCTTPDNVAVALDLQAVLFRGCVVRSTEFVNGVVAYTGADTKIMLNSGKTPSKRSRIEKNMNPQILIIFGIQIAFAILVSILQMVWRRQTNTLLTSPTGRVSIFFDHSGDGKLVSFYTFWTMLLITQNLVPIALYASVEVVKLCQAYFIGQADSMRYGDKHCVPRSWNLSDNLGQIEYIFSDKTGTLTSNEMKLRQCSIAGIKYGLMIDPSASHASPSASGELRSVSANGETSQFARYPTWRSDIADARARHPKPEAFDYTDDEFNFSDLALRDALVDVALQPDAVDADTVDWTRGSQSRAFLLRHYMRTLAICHSVVVKKAGDRLPGSLDYNASSPDEGALVSASKNFGYVFLGRARGTIDVLLEGVPMTVEILHEIAFDSDRKRMSVVARMPDGSLYVYCKGADTVIMELLDERNDQKLVLETQSHLDEFASIGLRTLVLAMRKLPEATYQEWAAELEKANADTVNRDQRVAELAAQLECNLILLGATAIEDELQLGVPETISDLLDAGMHVWMLTGDKLETAVNIAYTCHLFPPATTSGVMVHKIVGRNMEAVREALKNAEDHIRSGVSTTNLLVIDGSALKHALTDELSGQFVRVSTKCHSVICCRVAPRQKADIVRVVQQSKVGTGLCLAVGDGANDVAMIQRAHLGVGISGHEGRQAVNSSDFAIGRFRFLANLLLVHGRWAYTNSAAMSLTFFHKNFVFIMPLILFQFSCGYTAQMVYQYSYQMFYNLVFTSLPPIFIAVLDQELGAKELLMYPRLYEDGILRKRFNARLFWLAILDGCWQGTICYLGPVFGLEYVNNAMTNLGFTYGLYDISMVICMCAVICAIFTMALNVHNWTWITHASIWGSFLLFFIYHILVGGFVPPNNELTYDMYGLLYSVLGQAAPYLVTLLTVVLALMPRYALKYYDRMYHFRDADIVAEMALGLGKSKQPSV